MTSVGPPGAYATLGVPSIVEASEFPTEFVADSDTTYSVPSVNPEIVADVADAAGDTDTADPPPVGVADNT